MGGFGDKELAPHALVDMAASPSLQKHQQVEVSAKLGVGFEKCAKLEEWQQESCGGWSLDDIKEKGGKLPQSYQNALLREQLPVGAPEDLKEGKGVFCCKFWVCFQHYNTTLFKDSMVMNPPEPTFDYVRKIALKCDGYMFFSNFRSADLILSFANAMFERVFYFFFS